jgi:hypothetical protein
MVVALLALFVALGGVGVAATGGTFILGQSNTADKQTALAGTINGNPTLRAENAGTAPFSYGIVGKATSASADADSAGVKGMNASTNPAAPAVLGKNTGGGPGLAANVSSNSIPPLSVNSNAKVDNLNADQLDGLDSTSFLAATGTAANSSKLGGAPATAFWIDGGNSFGHTAILGAQDNHPLSFISDGLDLLTIGGTHSIDTMDGAYEDHGTWTDASDRALKHDFRPLDSERVLHKVARMPITNWSYKSEKPSIRHIGPMAQDFYKAFGLGLDNKHITTIDEGGVALAAIQGLYRQNRSLRAENRALRTRLSRLEKAVFGGATR